MAEYTNVMFGTGGDPLGTNKMMCVLADTYGLSAIGRHSRFNHEKEYFDFCLEVFDVFGVDACKVIAFNKKAV